MKNLPVAGMLSLAVTFALAGTDAEGALRQVADIADLELEQLTRITVTSASRREERAVDAPASIFVITAEDIRRSGATSIPEVLRLAPNLHVARADNNQYAITARGFNNVLANKLLVLIDGRTVYTPLFSGVFWEAQDVALDDIDRIEVISGPGATLWGANAVNGIINITTVPAGRSQGVLARGVVGTDERGATLRYGGALGPGHYRAYARYWERDGQQLASGADVMDASRRANFGFRGDWAGGGDQWTVQADGYWGDIEQMPANRSISGASVLGRLTRQLGAESTLRVQAYYDRTEREHPQSFEESLDIVDLEAQHSLRPIEGHSLIWGGGYRHGRDRVVNSASQAFLPADRSLNWSNVFVQDEIALTSRLALTLGIKAERNPYTGVEWLPNARLAWQPTRDQLVWGALSRAVRAPSRLDRELNFPGTPPFLLVGSDTFQSEVANVAELGYRAQFSTNASVSATLFHHDYPNLRSIALSPGGPTFANDIEGTVTGIEAWGSLRFTSAWRISGGFVLQNVDRNVKAGNVDLGGMSSLGNDPERKALLRSTWDVRPGLEFDLTLRHVGALPNPAVPAYTVLDARLGWRVLPSLDLSLIVHNALDKEHAEWGAPSNRVVFDRAVMLRAIYRL
jgi:iron complex outermembrane receptor protein